MDSSRFNLPNDPLLRPDQDIWERVVWPKVVPLVIAIGGGLALGWLVTHELWVVGVGIVAAIPVGVLLNQYPFLTVLVWFFLMPFLPPGGVPAPVLWVVHRALIPLGLVVGVFILPWLTRRSARVPIAWGWAEWSMVIYLALAVVSILLTVKSPLPHIYQFYDRVFVGFAAYWLVRFWSPTERDIKALTLIAGLVCLAEIILGFWKKYAPGSLPAAWHFSQMGTRMSGTFNNPTPYAYVLILCIVLLLHYAMNSAGRTLRIGLLSVCVLGIASIFMTFTRGCWLAAGLVLLGLIYLYPRPMTTLVAVMVPVFLLLSSDVLADEIKFALKRLRTERTVDSRIVMNYAGQQMFLEKPFFGWGYESYDRHDWRFMERVGGAAPTEYEIYYGTSHSTYLTILAETGVVGFFFKFFPLFWWAMQTVKALPNMPRRGFWSRNLVIVLWLSVLFYMVAGQLVDMRFFWYQLGLLWITMGLIGHIVQGYLPKRSRQVSPWLLSAVHPERSEIV